MSVESLFQYAYENRHVVSVDIPGAEPSTDYDNLLYHGIFRAICDILIFGLFASGVESAPLPVNRAMAERLRPGDLVINLNYDPLFEMAAEKAGHSVSFVPNVALSAQLRVAKPHGSLNLMVRGDQFTFMSPYFNTLLPAGGWKNYKGFIPPRRNKALAEHPIGKMIADAVREERPDSVVRWGIGLPESDMDLVELVSHLCRDATEIDFVNPSLSDCDRASALLRRPMRHYSGHEDWLGAV